jgi:3',5'-cyclic AMP phosphodiesterase CpdA
MLRRDFLKTTGTLGLGCVLPISLVEVAFAKESPAKNFTFAFISDSHIQQIKGNTFVRNWDKGLQRAIAECNLLDPKPDFVMYGGDIAQLGKAAEIDHGLEMLSACRSDLKFMLGEHDYYLDLGKHWSKRLGKHYYSFNHKGVHFVVLNSILTDEAWTKKWSSGEERMGVMAGLDNPLSSPFMVGAAQRKWLADDLAKVSKDTPVVVFSHSPLQKIFKGWNFWTEDAELIQEMLKPFDKVNVIYGHVHQIQYNQIGNISFHSVMATAWPWPYPSSYSQAKQYLPKLTIEMNRADPFFERDATGWQYIDIHSGNIDIQYLLPSNENRKIVFNTKTKQPEDSRYQKNKIPPQKHY